MKSTIYNHTLLPHQNLFSKRSLSGKQILFLLLIIFSVSVLTQCEKPAFAARPAFKSISSSLPIGRKMTVRIKNLPKRASVSFYSSKHNIAVIGKKSGRISARNPGKTIITAKIHTKKGKTVFLLKKKLTILPQNTYLKNVSFSLSQKEINPWDFTVTLSSSRILLKKEIKKSSLTLSGQNKSTHSLFARFCKLSSDGKKITYRLDADSAKALCPMNGTMDGIYKIRSAFFTEKLKISYMERINRRCISGFVLHLDGTPVKNAQITCHTDKGNITVQSSSAGYYRITSKETPVSLTVSKSGYQTEALNSLLVSPKGTICENFVLKPADDTSKSLEITITDEERKPVSAADIYLIRKKNLTKTTENAYFSETDAILHTKTDENGTVFLQKNPSEKFPDENKNRTSKITFKNTLQISLDTESVSHTNIRALPDNFSWNEACLLYVTKEDDTGQTGWQPGSLSFSPSAFYTDHLAFHICLKKNEPLNIKNLFLKSDSEQEKLPDSLFLSLYLPFQKKPVVNIPFSASESLLPVSLSDGSCYLFIHGENESGVYSSELVEATIKNGTLLPVTVPVKKGMFSRILLSYMENPVFPDTLTKKTALSFDIFQKENDSLFYLDSITSESFTETSSGLFTAHLFCSFLSEGKTYLLLPKETGISISPSLINPMASNLFQSKENALLAPPLSGCICSFSKENSGFTSHTDADTKRRFLLPENIPQIDQNTVRASDSYPNSIIAIYKKNGTLLSTSLLPKLREHTGFSENPDTITDIYTNHELLQTSQTAYH